MPHGGWNIWDRLMGAAARVHCHRLLRRFYKDAQSAAAVQERVLQRLIARGRDSAFGREHGFAHVRTAADYQRQVPVRTYADFAPYLDRVRAGETNALFPEGERILMFALTSGSTDRPKHIPVTPTFVKDYRRGWNIFGIKALTDHPDGFLRGILQVTSRMDESRTARGVPCGSISGLLAATQKRLVRKYYVVPPQTAAIADAEARYYSIMRFAVPRDVSWIVTASPATTLKLARTAADHAERLIRDMRDGTLNPPGEPLEPPLRATLGRTLAPDAVAARRLEALVDRHGSLRPRDFWRLCFLANWTGGTMGLHLRDFAAPFGDTPVRDIGLLATEGRVTLGVEDGTPSGLLDVAGGFFEFLPPEEDADPCGGGGAALLCHQLEGGAEYRVMLTNSAGLYRYDIGDRVRATGFVGQAPLLEFLHRGSRVSSMTGEKLTEWQVVEAYRRACEALHIEARLFVLSPRWSDPPFYRLHVETGRPGVEAATATLGLVMDRALSELNIEYAGKRATGRLALVEVNLLPAGTLETIDDRRRAQRGGANEQFKRQYLHTLPGEDAELPIAAPDAFCPAAIT
ncbi:MAG: GH3 auxin-responsive promoter family protein [Phycisphaerales bacterium]|nr:GH3 auxin-responsive promoter family protein [Phycisphaerales bacterium]